MVDPVAERDGRAAGASGFERTWLSPEVVAQGPVAVRRAEVALAVLGIVALIAPVRAVQMAARGEWLIAALIATNIPIVIVACQWVRARGVVGFMKHAAPVLLGAATVFACVRTGGVGLPVGYGAALIPLVIALILGWRAAALWTACLSALFVWLGWELSQGVVFPARPSPPTDVFSHTLWTVIFTVCTCLLGIACDWLQVRAIDQLEQANDALAGARAEAERTSRARGDFVATMSHEIRTPMNGVVGMIDLLLETPLGPEQRELAETASRSAQALLSLLNDVLDTSRIESGRVELERVPFDLGAVVEDVARLFAVAAREKGVDLAWRYPDGAPRWFAGDPVRIRQVLTNLAGNAVKFTREGFVRVEAEIPAAAEGRVDVLLQVRDSGIGLSAEEQGRIFERFTQAASSTARRYGGSGLGLSIARDLVRLMGGAIDVESVPGEGSTFSVRLPLCLAPAPGVEPARAETPRLSGRVLLVEDHPVNRTLALRLVERLGCATSAVCSGREALELLAKESFDLILMDCQMPEMDGFAATAEIRRRESAAGAERTPIVALTANAMPGDRERCLAAGMDDYLTKPLRREALAQTLARHLG